MNNDDTINQRAKILAVFANLRASLDDFDATPLERELILSNLAASDFGIQLWALLEAKIADVSKGIPGLQRRIGDFKAQAARGQSPDPAESKRIADELAHVMRELDKTTRIARNVLGTLVDLKYPKRFVAALPGYEEATKNQPDEVMRLPIAEQWRPKNEEDTQG